MALSMVKSESGDAAPELGIDQDQNLCRSDKISTSVEAPGDGLFEGEESDTSSSNSRSKRQKPWKSTPSLCAMNKSGSGAEEHKLKSNIPIPISKPSCGSSVQLEKGSLFLENLRNSNSQNDSVKGLPDVTESPQTSEKPCDLLAQLEIVRLQREMETSPEGNSPPGESDSVDDNGNPVEIGLNPEDGVPEIENKNFEDHAFEGTDRTNSPDNEKSRSVSVSETQPATGVFSEVRPLSFNESLSEKLKTPEEPKYFINAAALSEDTFELPPSPAPSPCSSHFSSLTYVDPYPSLCPFVPDRAEKKDNSDKIVPEKLVPTTASCIPQPERPPVRQKLEKASGSPQDRGGVRPRVPVSKSFPDIVQTTLSGTDEVDGHPTHLNEKATKDNSDTESLVADSLEDVRLEEKATEERKAFQAQDAPYSDKPLRAFEQPLPSYSTFDPMTESQIGGISAEKPPEAWVIDFNSLSLESDLMESSRSDRKSSMGSNPNSLAFFVNLDEKNGTATQTKEAQEAASASDKKIFTMFVEIGDKDGIPDNQEKSSDSESLMSASMTMGSKRSGIINKPVLSIMETSGCGLKYSMNRRFPSPIFQHKIAAEANRKAARIELQKNKEKQKEQFLDSLEPTSQQYKMGIEEQMMKSQLHDSTSSNRSSLHVANVLDASFTSSLLSSMENSSPADLEVCQGGPCFKLGKDLLRMFQEGINTDVNIVVNGKCIKAHKCILASRSQYFAAILSGNWVENAGNTINLDGFSYTVVQFTMYHIYSGTNEIPDTIDLLELATLTDLLGLEGLRENISQTIRAKFCHNFHRPCTGCIAGVIECFPIALAYGMDELHRKMTKWICKHFVRIWPTKAFANLGDELIEKCLRYSVNHLSVDNILDHTLGCDQLLTTMPTVRWTEPIFSIVGQLSEACVQYIGEHFCEVLQCEKFLLFGKGQTWNISRIEGTFMEALNLLKPDEACVSHTALTRLIELGTETIDEVEWSTLFVDFLKMLRGEIERYLLANASKAVLSKGWEQLGNDVRKKICTSSFMGFDKYGNKIVKNQGSSGHHGATTTTQVPVQNVKPTTKDRSQHYTGGTGGTTSRGSKVSTNRQMSVPVTTTVTRESNKEPILSPITTNPAKVASVRPMPAAKPPSSSTKSTTTTATATAVIERQSKTRSSSKNLAGAGVEQRENKTFGRVASQKSFTPPSQSSTRASGTVQRKFPSVEREKSFSRSPRPSSSASRTPLKPLTPSKTDSPLIQPGPSSEGSTVTYGRSTIAASRKSVAQKIKPTIPTPIVPPAKVFLTNSAKAAAVSKPNLKKRTPSTSSTSLLSQQQQNVASPKMGMNVPPSSQPKYLNMKEANKGGFSARSSFSSVDRPGSAATSTRAKAQVSLNQRRNTYSNAGTANSNVAQVHRNIPSTSSGGSSKRPLSGGSMGQHVATAEASMATSVNRNITEHSKENVMSRSTIETDSGETKIRTLAEIGRSSTFSKDEPTILGKMDSSTYSTLDMEISP